MIPIPDNMLAKIEFLAGNPKKLSRQPMAVWHQVNLDFLIRLSKSLRQDENVKKIPELMTFAFWIRQANLLKLKQNWHAHSPYNLGLGMSFHLCPANVPLNFAYSMVFGLLSGNTSVIRLSSKPSDAVDILLQHIRHVLETLNVTALSSRLLIMRYSHDDEVTQFWLKNADARVIWGGDNTINYINQFSTPTRSRAVLFADRYSFALINAKTIVESDTKTLKNLVDNLYNDIYLMDQAACSSPQLFIWFGEASLVKQAQQIIFPQLAKLAAEKYHIQGIQVMDKYVALCDYAISYKEVNSITQWNSYLTTVELSKLSSRQQQMRSYYGSVFNLTLDNFEQLLPLITEKVQTLSYFGISADSICQFLLENGVRGVDRIVPIGKSVDMDIYWDGYDIIASLSRQLTVLEP